MVVKGETDAPPIQWVSALFVREDQSLAAALVAELAGRGVPFPDAPLASVDIYPAGNQVDIDAATVVLAVCSPVSTRDVPFLDQAKRAHGRTFAVTLADVPSLPGELGGVQPFDLSGWQGDIADPRLDQLARALISALAERAAPGSADGSAATAESQAGFEAEVPSASEVPAGERRSRPRARPGPVNAYPTCSTGLSSRSCRAAPGQLSGSATPPGKCSG